MAENNNNVQPVNMEDVERKLKEAEERLARARALKAAQTSPAEAAAPAPAPAAAAPGPAAAWVNLSSLP